MIRSCFALVLLLAVGADVASSASRGRIAYVQPRGAGSVIVESGLDGASPTVIPSVRQRDAAPVWSPDGSHIAFNRGGTWFAAPSSGTGPAVRVGGTGNDGWLVWSPDSQLTAVAPGDCILGGHAARIVIGDNGHLHTIRLRLRAADRPGGGDGAEIGLWGFSPDGRSLLVSVDLAGDACRIGGLTPAALYVVSLDGKRQQRFATGHPLWSATWSPDGGEVAYSPMCAQVCVAIALRLSDGVRRPLFALAGPVHQDPAGLDVVWRLGRLIVAASPDIRPTPIYTVEPGRPRRLLGHGQLVQCECAGLVAFDTGANLVLADPATTHTWSYPSRLGPPLALGDEAVFLTP